MERPNETMTEVLKRTIAASGMTLIAIERATGVKRASVMRFLRGCQSLRLDMANRLAEFFGLELRPRKKGR